VKGEDPSGAKALRAFCGTYGTAEAVPLQNAAIDGGAEGATLSLGDWLRRD
jgi:hypothetical protein